MAQAYTLILTHGFHTVLGEEYERISTAIENGDKLVDVAIDYFGDGKDYVRTTVVVAHVVAMAETSLDIGREDGPTPSRRLEIVR